MTKNNQVIAKFMTRLMHRKFEVMYVIVRITKKSYYRQSERGKGFLNKTMLVQSPNKVAFN